MNSKLEARDARSSYPAGAMAGRPASSEAPPFGRRVAALRKERGLSQAQLAHDLGIKLSLVAYYERRANNPSLGFVEKLARVLGVTVAELVGERVTQEPHKRGPRSQLEEKFDLVRRLPRAKQKLVVRMIDAVLDEERRSA